jgi:hypothetical protein
MPISYTPTNPVVDEEITLSIVGEESARWELTAVPEESSLSTGVLLDLNDEEINTFTGDVTGVYTVAAYEVIKHTVPSSYPGDPSSYWEEYSQVDSGYIYVGEGLTLPIVTKYGHSAKLRIVVHDEEVTAASITEPSGDLARIAGQQTAVVAALAALVGKTIDVDFGNDFIARVNDLRTRYKAHIADAVAHNSADTTNTIEASAAGTALEGALQLLEELAVDVVAHMTTYSDVAVWHNEADMDNWPVTRSSPFLPAATVFLADLTERGYERHRMDATVHNSADTTNDMGAPAVLTTLIVEYLDALADLTAAAPTGEQEGTVDARHAFGFE